MRSQPNCFEVVFVVVVFIVLVVVVLATLNVDLRLLVMEVEFGWVGVVLGGCCDGWVLGCVGVGVMGCKVIIVSNSTQLSCV